MGQSRTSKFDKLFTLICTDNTQELARQLRSCSSSEQTNYLSNLSDADKAVTLLMYAAFYGNLTICRLLVDYGAQLLSQDKEGRNVLYYAMAGQSYNVAEYLLEMSVKNLNNEIQKSFINNIDNNGETCLHEAVKIQAVSCIKLLIKHNIDINIANRDGSTALHRAVDLDHSDIVRLLINHNAKLNMKDASGWTPLHIACVRNDAKLVSLLLSYGAHMNVTDNDDRSPLKLARETNARDVIECLKNYSGKDFDSRKRPRRRKSERTEKEYEIPQSQPSPTTISLSLPNEPSIHD